MGQSQRALEVEVLITSRGGGDKRTDTAATRQQRRIQRTKGEFSSLVGSGLIIVNPSEALYRSIESLLGGLTRAFGGGSAAKFSTTWIGRK